MALKLIVEINGRFGNHLHQLVAGASIAKDYNLDFYANSSNNQWAYQDYLDIPLMDINKIEYVKMGVPPTMHSPLYFQKNTYLSSYFLNYKWHWHNRDYILDKFQFKQKFIDEAKKIINSFNKKTCAVHVRRDDYVALDYYPLVAEEYYRKAVEEFQGSQFIVCSDDMEWCKSFFGGLDGDFYFSENEFIVDFLIMSMTNYNVIANSSFSYWAAYFNRQAEKIWYPCVWSYYFGKDGRDIDELCPPDWVKIIY